MSKVLSDRVLNRTLLQRQLLLERASMPPIEAVEHLVGLQAQLPLDPYYALWSRLEGFEPSELAAHVEQRDAVRAVLMRGTLHLVTAGDARTLWPRMEPMLTRTFGATAWGRQVRAMPEDERRAFCEEGRRVLHEQPLAAGELAARMGEQFGHVQEQARRAMTYVIPVVQVTPRGVWGKTLPPTWANLDDWVRRPLRTPIPLPVLVRRYLAAFGPASVADFQNWSRLTGMRETFEGMRKRLRTYAPSPAGSCSTFAMRRSRIRMCPPRCASFPPTTTWCSATTTDRGSSQPPEARARFSPKTGTSARSSSMAWSVRAGRSLRRSRAPRWASRPSVASREATNAPSPARRWRCSRLPTRASTTT